MERSIESRTRTQQVLLVVGIIFIGLNLRPALASVGPLVSSIREATGLSNVYLGLLTTLPLIGFAVFSTLTPVITRRFGVERTLVGAMLLLATGLVVRVAPSVILLFAGTALTGIAIALGNVLLPTIVKRDFPHQTGFMTSMYSSAMGLGATAAAGVSYPLSLALGWRGSLLVWTLLAIAAAVVWMPMARRRTHAETTFSLRQSLKDLSRSPIAWQVACFMGLQSMTFYVLLTWLPELLIARGATASFGGWMLALSQFTGLFGSMFIPMWADRLPDQRRAVWMLAAAECTGIIGLLLPGLMFVPIAVVLLGFVLGGTFGLALLFIVLRTPTSQIATELSGVAQSVGYALAAFGPIMFGFLHDLVGGWRIPLVALLFVLGLKLMSGLGAGRARIIGNAE